MEAEICCNGKLITNEEESERGKISETISSPFVSLHSKDRQPDNCWLLQVKYEKEMREKIKYRKIIIKLCGWLKCVV